MTEGLYPYRNELRVLEGRRPKEGSRELPPEFAKVTTPLVVREWRTSMSQHPDKWYATYIESGLREGFRIGFRYEDCVCTSVKANMHSAVTNSEVIDSYLGKELSMGRVLGPLDPRVGAQMQVSRFGVIPKNHQPGKWRLILDLSHPAGASVNDGIERELCSLKYTSVDEAVQRFSELGKGALLAKLDIESAYRLIPVHPDDRLLLGMSWKGNLYADASLPFGLRSAPKIFNAVADALMWIMGQQGTRAIHYLDDYLLFGAPNTPECQLALARTLATCDRLGVPIAKHKTEGPACQLTFLGIELDTQAGVVRLPPEKLMRLQREIRGWSERKAGSKRELLSLIGQLQHACCVVKPGRSFLRRMISLSTVAKELHHRIRLNVGFRSDLQWWATFLQSWNGVSVTGPHPSQAWQATITSDASGNWGCGSFSSEGHWFQLQWPSSWATVHITVKELLPIIVSIALWDRSWHGSSVRCRCDNAAVVAIIRSGTCKDDLAMHLLRCLFFFVAAFDIKLWSVHIPGVCNGAADALSRDNHTSFLAQVPSARRQADVIPPEMLEVLVTRRPDWTSLSWTELLKSISQKD